MHVLNGFNWTASAQAQGTGRSLMYNIQNGILSYASLMVVLGLERFLIDCAISGSDLPVSHFAILIGIWNVLFKTNASACLLSRRVSHMTTNIHFARRGQIKKCLDK